MKDWVKDIEETSVTVVPVLGHGGTGGDSGAAPVAARKVSYIEDQELPVSFLLAAGFHNANQVLQCETIHSVQWCDLTPIDQHQSYCLALFIHNETICHQESAEAHVLPQPEPERALAGDQDEEGVAGPHRRVRLHLQGDHHHDVNHR